MVLVLGIIFRNNNNSNNTWIGNIVYKLSGFFVSFFVPFVQYCSYMNNFYIFRLFSFRNIYRIIKFPFNSSTTEQRTQWPVTSWTDGIYAYLIQNLNVETYRYLIFGMQNCIADAMPYTIPSTHSNNAKLVSCLLAIYYSLLCIHLWIYFPFSGNALHLFRSNLSLKNI